MKLTIDPTEFDQEQKNLTHGALSSLLYRRGILHGGIKKVDDGAYDLQDPYRVVDDVRQAVAADDDGLKITATDISEEITYQKELQAQIVERVETLEEILARFNTAGSIDELRRHINNTIWPD